MKELIKEMRDLLAEAIDTHIYNDGDERNPEDCAYHRAVAAADKFLAAYRDNVPRYAVVKSDATKSYRVARLTRFVGKEYALIVDPVECKHGSWRTYYNKKHAFEAARSMGKTEPELYKEMRGMMMSEVAPLSGPDSPH